MSGVNTREVTDALEAAVATAHEGAFDPRLLDRAVAEAELELVESLENLSGKTEQMGLHYLLRGDSAGVFSFIDALHHLELSDLRRAAKNCLRTEPAHCAVIDPGVPDEED